MLSAHIRFCIAPVSDQNASAPPMLSTVIVGVSEGHRRYVAVAAQELHAKQASRRDRAPILVSCRAQTETTPPYTAFGSSSSARSSAYSAGCSIPGGTRWAGSSPLRL